MQLTEAHVVYAKGKHLKALGLAGITLLDTPPERLPSPVFAVVTIGTTTRYIGYNHLTRRTERCKLYTVKYGAYTSVGCKHVVVGKKTKYRYTRLAAGDINIPVMMNQSITARFTMSGSAADFNTEYTPLAVSLVPFIMEVANQIRITNHNTYTAAYVKFNQDMEKAREEERERREVARQGQVQFKHIFVEGDFGIR